MDRKEEIIKLISQSDKPVSASKLAKALHVSRQIIVGDVALIRAAGTEIIATPRGYMMDQNKPQLLAKIAVKHDESRIEDELNLIVDMGGEVIDVIVEHPVYGEIKASLHTASRFDVAQFMDKLKTAQAEPLSSLTNGVHLHTIAYKSEAMLKVIKEALKAHGFLYEDEESKESES
jgi:transcriptional regulator of NAD metabolism